MHSHHDVKLKAKAPVQGRVICEHSGEHSPVSWVHTDLDSDSDSSETTFSGTHKNNTDSDANEGDLAPTTLMGSTLPILPSFVISTKQLVSDTSANQMDAPHQQETHKLPAANTLQQPSSSAQNASEETCSLFDDWHSVVTPLSHQLLVIHHFAMNV